MMYCVCRSLTDFQPVGLPQREKLLEFIVAQQLLDYLTTANLRLPELQSALCRIPLHGPDPTRPDKVRRLCRRPGSVLAYHCLHVRPCAWFPTNLTSTVDGDLRV